MVAKRERERERDPSKANLVSFMMKRHSIAIDNKDSANVETTANNSRAQTIVIDRQREPLALTHAGD